MTVSDRSRLPLVAVALAVAALVVAVLAASLGSSSAAGPTATSAKALGTKKLTVRKAGVVVPAGGFRNGNFNSASVGVLCAPGEVALSASTLFPGQGENTEVVTRWSRLTVSGRGKPNGATASGATDLATPAAFEVHVLCAG